MLSLSQAKAGKREMNGHKYLSEGHKKDRCFSASALYT